MKELNLKIKKCEDCPYSKVKDKDMSWESINCGMRGGERIRSVHSSDKVSLPSWCPLKDCREQGVKVGVAVFVFNENKEVLIGNRTLDDLWGLPGGGMIAGETPPETAKRETKEETGIEIDSQKIYFATFTNNIFLKEKNEHWVTLYFICDYTDWTGTLERKEPNECSEWKWSNLDELSPNPFCDWGKFIPKLKEIIKNG